MTSTTYEAWLQERRTRMDTVMADLADPAVDADTRRSCETELSAIAERDEYWDLRRRADQQQTLHQKAAETWPEVRERDPDAVDPDRDHAGQLREIGMKGFGSLRCNLRNVAAEHRMLKDGWTAKDLVEHRAQMTTPDGAGGYLIPTDLERMVYHKMLAQPGVRYAGAQVIRTSEGNDRNLPFITRPKKSGTLEQGEGVALTATDLAATLVSLGAYKYSSMKDVSKELLQDVAIDIEDEISTSFAWELANATNQRYTNGTRSSMPKGVLHGLTAASTNVTQIASKTDVTILDLRNALFKLDPGYYSAPVDAFVAGRRGLNWMMHPTTFANIISQEDSQNRPIFMPTTTTTQPFALLGYPVTFNVEYPAIGADNVVVTVGSIYDHYLIRDAGDMMIEVSPHSKFAEGVVQYRADLRTDGNIRDADAVHHIMCAS